MPRATNAPASRERRKRMVEKAKGFRGRRSKLFRYAKNAVMKADTGRIATARPASAISAISGFAHQRRRPRERHHLQPIHGRHEGARASGSTAKFSPISP